MIAYHFKAERLLLRDVLLQADGAHATDNALYGLDVGYELLVVLVGKNLYALCHDALAGLAFLDSLPQLFGDEGHEGVEQAQQGVEVVKCGIVGLLVDSTTVGGLHNLKIPAGELIPEQAVYSHQCLAQAVLAHQVVHLEGCLGEHSIEPLATQAGSLGLSDGGIYIPTLHEAEGVPNLVVEVTALLAECIIEEDVVAGRSAEHHTHTHAIGTILGDEVERVGRVAEALRHLASQLVAYDTGEVYILEWHVALVLVACHNHTCYPEENDVRAGHQV